MILKRCIVPTGEPCNTETVPHGSVGGRGKRRVSDLARGLPNLVPRSRFRQQVSASVRLRYCTFAGSALRLKINLRESLEMPWPVFNELGDLPIGVYRATLADVIAHFGHGTAQRVTITARLERIYELARRTGAMQRFILFGSYVTAEPNPRDVDIFLVMRGGFQPREAPPEAQPLFRHDTAQSELGASIFWVNAETSFADTEDLIIGWQTRRDLQQRGMWR